MCLMMGSENVAVDQSEMRFLKLCRNPSLLLLLYILFNAISYHSGVRMVQK